MIEVRSDGRGNSVCRVEGKSTLKELISDGAQCVAAIIGIIAQTDGEKAARLYAEAVAAMLRNDELVQEIIEGAIEQARKELN